MAQHARPVGPTTNAAASFSPEMASGYRPDRPIRYESRNRAGVSLSQPTHVSAPFFPEMATGWHSETSRAFVPPQLGIGVSQPTHVSAAVSINMLGGWQPAFDVRATPFSQGGSFSPPDVLAFGIESVIGARPSSPRLFLAPRIPLTVSQPTHIQAVLSPEMAAGWQPSIDVRSAPFTQGATFSSPDVSPFSIEMVQGWHPDAPSLFRGPRLGLQLSQTTHGSAGISPEMLQGWLATADVRCIPFTQGSWTAPPEVLSFSIEMAQGWHADRARVFLAPRIDLPISQTTQIAAPITLDMLIGARPDRARSYVAPKAGLTVPPPDVLIFSIEMVAGSHPDAPRILMGKRIPLPISQTSPVNAPLSQEMTAGALPPTSRGWVYRRVMTGPWADVHNYTYQMLDASCIIQVGPDQWVVLVAVDPKLGVPADPHVLNTEDD